MEVIVGTYEELILGYKLIHGEKGYKFKLNFTNHSHAGCIKSAATSKRGLLATGSTDEVIRLFNLKKHVEIGALMHHDGVITSLSFYKKTHMFSTSSDGTICIWQVGKWECLRTLRGHKGAVNSFSVHPTGKMALSVGQDRKLRVWNLMTGKCSFIKNIKQEADLIKWSPSGNIYIVVINNKVDIYDIATAEVTHTMDMTGRINDVQFLMDDVIVLGGEEGKLKIYDIKAEENLLDFSTNTNRIKGISWCTDPEDPDGFLLVTASSDGFVKAWQLKQQKDHIYQITPVSEIQTKFRLTCCTMYCYKDGQQEATQKKLAKEFYEEADKEEDLEGDKDKNEKVDHFAEQNVVRDRKAKKWKHDSGLEKDPRSKQTLQSALESNRKKLRMVESSHVKLKKKQKIKRLKPTRL